MRSLTYILLSLLWWGMLPPLFGQGIDLQVVDLQLHRENGSLLGVEAKIRLSQNGEALEDFRLDNNNLTITTDTVGVAAGKVDTMKLLGVPQYLRPQHDSAANYLVLFDFASEKAENGFYGVLLRYQFTLTAPRLNPTPVRGQDEAALGDLLIPQGVSINWADALVVGALLLSLLLLAMSEGIPIWDRLQFRSTYVKEYHEVAVEGKIQKDPMTLQPFGRSEKVVVKCPHLTSLASWEENHHQCLSYPDDCQEGFGGAGEVAFFSMRGPYRSLNWLWFGALGGFLSWLAQLLLLAGFEGLTMQKSVIPGLALGLGLTFALAWAEERGQSRDFSWGRILLRAGCGMVAGGLIYFLGDNISAQIFGEGDEIWKQSIPIILLGLSLGGVLSIRSSISWQQGLLGGALASIAGFAIYLLILQGGMVGLAQVLGYISLGAVLGIGLVSYVRRLESFELEYLSPPEFRRTVPISKWLKANQEVQIGSDPACDVFVKWTDDQVAPQHATLHLKNGQVYLEAWAETLIQGRRMPERQEIRLKNGDIIQLGTDSISRMQFIATTKES
ncbi:MAG: FHA domain-containing protein [Bacteroidota bacterium]